MVVLLKLNTHYLWAVESSWLESNYLFANKTSMSKGNKDLFVLKVQERNAFNQFILTRKCIFVESNILRWISLIFCSFFYHSGYRQYTWSWLCPPNHKQIGSFFRFCDMWLIKSYFDISNKLSAMIHPLAIWFSLTQVK